MNTHELTNRFFTLLKKHAANGDNTAFVQYRSPSELRELLDLDRQDSKENWEHIFSWLEQYLHYSVNTSHPAFLNRMWAGANPPSILGEIVAAIANTSACTYESAPVSTILEQYMIGQMLALAGFSHGEGQMTTGSSNANMIAMMCARNNAGEKIKEAGLCGQQQLYAFVSADAHYSMDKAANILGIGIDHLMKIPVNRLGEMRLEALEKAIIEVLAKGGKPFFVGATLGTTVRGAYDHISDILDLRREYGFWLHGDGAWGGATIMSDRLRQRFMSGLSEIDSFTFDFHKMLGSALMCNVLLLNRSNHLLGTVLAGGDPSYIFRDTDDNEVRDLGTVSLQCGRRVDSLKWFLDWKFYGKRGLGRRVERYLQLCEYAEQYIQATPELEMVAPRVSYNVCFRYRTAEQLANQFNQELRTRLYHRGSSLVGIAYIGEQLTLRLLIANATVEHQDIDRFFENLLATGRELMKEEWIP